MKRLLPLSAIALVLSGCSHIQQVLLINYGASACSVRFNGGVKTFSVGPHSSFLTEKIYVGGSVDAEVKDQKTGKIFDVTMDYDATAAHTVNDLLYVEINKPKP